MPKAKTPWELIDEAATKALTTTGDIGRKGLTAVLAAGIALEKVVAYIATHKREGGFKAWCAEKQVCVKTCDRYRTLATKWDQVDKKAKAGDPEAVDLHRRLIDNAITPTVVAAERLLGIGVKEDAIPKTIPAPEPKATVPKAEQTAKQRVETFAAKVNDLVNDMGWIEVELYAGRVTPEDIAAPLDRVIREATELRAKNPFAGPAKREEAAEAAKPVVPSKPKPVAPSEPKKANGPSVARRGRPQGEMIFNEDGE